MAEWSKAPDSKSGLGQPNGGSNPSLSATSTRSAHVLGQRDPFLPLSILHSHIPGRRAASLRRFILLGCLIAVTVPWLAAGQSLDPDAAFQRGVALQEAGRFNEAIKAYDEAIQLGTSSIAVYNNRGAAYGGLGRYERAIPDFDRAIQLDSRYTEAYCNRGAAFGALKQYDRAIRDFDRAIQLDPKYARAYNNLAWLLATAADPAIRDGRRATELALKACELSSCQDAYLLDTLAAAFARVGDFAKAVEWQDKAMANPLHAQDRETQARLKLYRQGKAWPPD